MNFAEYKAATGLTDQQIADGIGLTRSMTTRILSGAANPSFKTAVAIERWSNGQVSRENWYPRQSLSELHPMATVKEAVELLKEALVREMNVTVGASIRHAVIIDIKLGIDSHAREHTKNLEIVRARVQEALNASDNPNLGVGLRPIEASI